VVLYGFERFNGEVLWMDTDCVYEDRYFQVVSPEFPLNCRDDGGHLILYKKEKVTDRSDLSYQEAIDFMRISMAVGRAMYDVLGVERMNYEDLGNWGSMTLVEPRCIFTSWVVRGIRFIRSWVSTCFFIPRITQFTVDI
jgi:hypothetical protein